jgi:hypothetical protein
MGWCLSNCWHRVAYSGVQWRERGKEQRRGGGLKKSVLCVLYALYAHAYTHAGCTGNHTLTHMEVSAVSDPKLDGMVPSKFLLTRYLLEGGARVRRE